MGQWKSQPTPHSHDMPGPRKLQNQGALPGWVWTCACAEDFELVEYRQQSTGNPTGPPVPGYGKWKDQAGNILHLFKE